MNQTGIYDDGMGTFQARCLDSSCGWRGPWRRNEAKAIEDARAHGAAEMNKGDR